jgi:membrane fusion protein, heavy metal efflux system
MKTIKLNTMTQSGNLNMMALLAIVFLSACGGSSSEVDEHGHEEHEEGESTTVSITQMQAETIGLEVGKIKKMPLSNTVKVTGVLQLFPQDRAEISPLIGGNVKSIHVIEGDEVKKGQLLATLQHPDFITMQQEFQMKHNSLNYLKLEYERQEKLYNEKVSSAKDYQAAKSQYLSTQAEVNGLKVKLEMLGLNVQNIMEGEMYFTVPVTSPISGYVHLVNVNIGEFASTQMGRMQVMFEITDNSRLHADFRVYEKDIYKVETGQQIYFTVANQPGIVLNATISSVGQAFEDDPRSVHVHAHIKNPYHKLLPGMYIEGRIATDSQKVMAVPEEAIVTEGESAFIFMQIEEEEENAHEVAESHSHAENEEGDKEHGHEELGEKLTFKKVKVVRGIHNAGYVEVKLFESLPENALFAFVGAYTLSSEMIKGELEHEH